MSKPAMWRDRGDAGETLIELLVAVVILGIAGVAVLAGMMLNVKVSTINRNQAGGGAYVRSAAEAIQKSIDVNGKYSSCADAINPTKDYTTAARSVLSMADLSNGYSAEVVEVQSWRGNSSGGWGSCDDKGIQRIKLKVTTPGDASHSAVETLVVVLRQPCGKAGTGASGVLQVGDNPC